MCLQAGACHTPHGEAKQVLTGVSTTAVTPEKNSFCDTFSVVIVTDGEILNPLYTWL